MTTQVVVTQAMGYPLYIAATSRVTMHVTDDLTRAARYDNQELADWTMRRANSVFAWCGYKFTVESITE